MSKTEIICKNVFLGLKTFKAPHLFALALLRWCLRGLVSCARQLQTMMLIINESVNYFIISQRPKGRLQIPSYSCW